MKKKRSIRIDLAIGIVILFIVSALSPMTAGFDVETVKVNVELERTLDHLHFMCTGPNGFNNVKYEYYKEKLLNQYLSESSNDEIIVESEIKELTIMVEQPSTFMSSYGGPMNSPWPIKCHDLHHTSQSPYSTVDSCTEKWRFYFSGWLEDTPVIDNNGTIYCKGAYNALDRYLYAIYPDGTEKWKYKTDGLILGSSPAIAEDGTVYIGDWGNMLHAINPDGTLKWKFNSGVNNDIASSPVITEDGSIYFGVMGPGENGRIYGVYPNGTEKWHYDTGYWITSDPCVGDDGTVYIGSGDTYFYAMNPDGTLKWRFKTGDYIKGPPSIADDGTVYIGSFDDYLYALYHNNGTMKWKCKLAQGTETNPSIANDGTIYVGSDKLYAIYPNGTKKWSFDIPGTSSIHQSSPAISAEGIIYFGTDGEPGYIFAVNPDGTERWHKKIANYWVESSPSIAEDGTVYIGSSYAMSEGYLHAFGVGELEVDADGPYFSLVDESVQFKGISSGGHSPHNYHWDFGDTFTSDEQNPIHIYSDSGNYSVVLIVTDNEGDIADDTTYAWIQTTNTAPDKPTINGPINGVVGTTYDYTFTATDPDNSIVYLYVDWGDNSNTGWEGPYDSEQDVTFSHKWTKEDTFTIKAKAKDPYDTEGPWETLDVAIPRDKATNNILLQKILARFPLLEKLLLFIK